MQAELTLFRGAIESISNRYTFIIMILSKRAEYAIRAVIKIARHTHASPIQIKKIAKSESIPLKFLEQILLNLKKNAILLSKRGKNGGYLLAKPANKISIAMIVKIVDGQFGEINQNKLSNMGLGVEKCFSELVTMVHNHLNQYTIQKIIEIDGSESPLEFDI